MRRWPEWFALSRMLFWVLLGLYIFCINPALKQSVALVIVLSLYANFGTDYGVYSGRRAERRAYEAGEEDIGGAEPSDPPEAD